MSEINETITLDQIEQYIAETKSADAVMLPYGDFHINVKTKLSIEEQNEFIDTVVSNAYIGSITPSWANIDAAFAISVTQFLTDIPIPTQTVAADGGEPEKEIIDSNRAYSVAKALNLAEEIRCTNRDADLLLRDLRHCVDKRIEFENQKLIAYMSQSGSLDDAAQAITVGANKFTEFMGKAVGILDTVNEKIGKHLTPNRVNRWINGIQQSVAKSLAGVKNNINDGNTGAEHGGIGGTPTKKA